MVFPLVLDPLDQSTTTTSRHHVGSDVGTGAEPAPFRRAPGHQHLRGFRWAGSAYWIQWDRIYDIIVVY